MNPRRSSTQQQPARRQAPAPAAQGRNSVALRGRVSSAPLERELPSGDVILTFRLVLARDRTPLTARSRQGSDWVDCVTWGGRVRRSVATWRVGDVVELEGALRRRFFRVDARTSTRVEVEVLAGRVVERAG
jgi:single-strand DNA-binding protein